MKKIVVWALVAVMAGAVGIENASAQKFELGARVGVGSQNMDYEYIGLQDAKARLGWNLAAVARIRIVGFGGDLLGAGLFFQPEVAYSQSNIKGALREFEELGGSTRASSGANDPKIRIATVDVPLLLSLKVSLVRVQAGPVFNLMNNFKDLNGQLELQPLRSAVGYAVGASVDLGALVIDGRYHGDFKKMEFKGQGWDGIKSQFSSWSLGVGLMF